jgi:hypothetical protein
MLNLFVGALRVRVTGAGAPRQYEHWAGRARASLVVATLPALIVMPIVFTFHQGEQIVFSTLPFGPSGIGTAGRIADDSFGVMAIATLSAIGMLLWGYAGLAGAVRRDSRNGRPLRRMVRVPGIAAALVVILWVSAIVVGPHAFATRHGVIQPLNGHPALSRGLLGAAAAVLALGLIGAVAMLVMVTRRASLALPDLSVGRWVGLGTSGLLWVMAGAAVVSVVALWRQGAPGHAAYSLVTTTWGSWWIAGALSLVGAAVLSTWGTVQATRALRVTSQLGP